MAREPPFSLTGSGVGVVRVREESETVVEERAAFGTVGVVLCQLLVHVREARTDAVLMSFQGVEIDRVCEVRREELVGLGFEFRSVRHEVSGFLVAARHGFVERRIDPGGEVTVRGVADRDPRVGIREERFRNSYGHRPPGPGGFLCCPNVSGSRNELTGIKIVIISEH